MTSFLAELKRRKVVRVAVVYAATGFVVLQAAELILPRLGIPEWALSLIVVLLLLGFPVALVLGWALELTPDGLRIASSAVPDNREAEPALLGRRTIVVSSLLVVLGVGLGAGWVLRPVGTPSNGQLSADAENEPTLAVMPFDNFSPDAGDAYFAGGITEEITSQLSRLAGIRVMSRTAVGRALESRGSLADLAAELGVSSVLEGSVRVAGDRVRITAQLIDARTGRHLWTEDYDRDFADIFRIQREVALAIVASLRARLAPGELEQIERPPTDNLVAYQLYLRSTQMPGNVAAQNRLAIELLREALALDPHFELAWSRLAWRYQWQTWHGDPAGPEKALEYSGIALELNPQSAEAHRARAAAYSAMRRNVEALAAFRRALEIDPDNLGALADGGWTAALLGDQAEGLRLSAGAMRTAANVPNQRYHVGIPLLLMDDDARLTTWLDLAAAEGMDHHRLDILRIGLKLRQGRRQEALEWLREAEARAGGHEEFEAFAAEVRLFVGDLDGARPTIEHLFRTNPDQPAVGVIDRTPRFSLALLLARQGERVRAQELLDDAMRVQLALVNAGATAFDPPLEIAAIHALKGDRDASLDWLERAFDAGFRAHRLLRQDAAFEPLRGDERFERLLGRMAELNAHERARVEAGAIAARIDAMIAAGPARREASE